MIINIINVLLSEYCFYDIIWYTEDENIFLKTLIKCIFYSIVPLLLFLATKKSKEKLILFSAIFLLLANLFMLLFKDVSNYIFSYVYGVLGIFSSLFLILSVKSAIKNKSKATNVLASLLNTIIIIFTFVTFTVVIPEGIVDFLERMEYVFSIGLGYGGFAFGYYTLQGVYLILMLNAFNLLLFDSCEDDEIGLEHYEAGYSNIAKHILMPFGTLGVYYIGWIYRITRYSDPVQTSIKRSKAKASEAIFLNLFIPFYSVYWYYKISKNIELLFEAKGKRNQNFSTLIIILSIFIPFVAYIVLQSKLNEAIKCTDEQRDISIYQEQISTYENNRKNYVDEIKALKDLLDMGAITPEEFAEKKKQLLNL